MLRRWPPSNAEGKAPSLRSVFGSAAPPPTKARVPKGGPPSLSEGGKKKSVQKYSTSYVNIGMFPVDALVVSRLGDASVKNRTC